MPSTLTSGAPYLDAHWLLSVLDTLRLQEAGYRTDAKGIAVLGRVTASFKWDDRNSQFYVTLIDTVPGTGCVGGDVVTGIDRQTQTVHQAADKVHRRVLQFLRRLGA